MAKPVEMPIRIRIGDAPEREIGTIVADSWMVARTRIANAMREAADVIEASGSEPSSLT